MKILPLLLKDAYKAGHVFQYPKGTTLVYSNLTPRKSRVEGVDKVTFFGLQYFLKEYLLKEFRESFFEVPRHVVLSTYKRRMDTYLGPGMNLDHIANLHELGFLPLHIKGVAEGSSVPFRTPLLTLHNTFDDFFWLTNMLETLLSNILWLPTTSATTALRYRKEFERACRVTGGDKDFIKWQGHDFSFRGLSGVESAALSGAAHLLSFTGTDTIPSIDLLEQFYGADAEKELIGGSVPATEHSVMSVGGQEDEVETFRRLLRVYPSGILSIVSDTWDFWKVLTEYLPVLKEEILGREGKIVIRPDSGDPVDILCGASCCDDPTCAEAKGAVQVLWDLFGGTTTSSGYKVLDSHVGLIYGDSITPERQREILSRLEAKGFASTNVVLGIGSYTYQHVTRDTFGLAMKATYAERKDEKGRVVGVPIFKDPATDDGTKRSAKGLLKVEEDGTLVEEVSWREEFKGRLRTRFLDGKLRGTTTLAAMRAEVEKDVEESLK